MPKGGRLGLLLAVVLLGLLVVDVTLRKEKVAAGPLGYRSNAAAHFRRPSRLIGEIGRGLRQKSHHQNHCGFSDCVERPVSLRAFPRSQRRRIFSVRAVEQQPQPDSTEIIWSSSGSKYRVLDEDAFENSGKPAPSDFYEMLGVSDKANTTEMKKAYRQIFRQCHPDKIGDDAAEFCELVNIAYDILTDETQRPIYDNELEQYKETEGETFDGRAKSVWGTKCNATESRAVFVDELTCIGCRMCSNAAEDTFGIEETWGRARVKTQWGDDEERIAEAIDSCPVDCIYWVQKRQLPLLEYIMGVCNRVSVASMMNGRSSSDSPFSRAETYLRTRKSAGVDGSLNRETNLIHNEKLQAAIARAWLQLPINIRKDLWPQYSEFQD